MSGSIYALLLFLLAGCGSNLDKTIDDLPAANHALQEKEANQQAFCDREIFSILNDIQTESWQQPVVIQDYQKYGNEQIHCHTYYQKHFAKMTAKGYIITHHNNEQDVTKSYSSIYWEKR